MTRPRTQTLLPGARSRYVYVTDNPQSSETPADPYCAGCAVFETDAQAEDLKIVGLPSLDLTVIPHGPGGNVTAYMYSADEADAWELLGYGAVGLQVPQGWARCTRRESGRGDEVIGLEFEPTDAVVQKGERLVLVLDQGDKNDMPGPQGSPVDLVYGGKASSFTSPS